MKASTNQHKPGFTLVEVLLVLGLLALSLGLIARMQVRSLDRIEQDTDLLQKVYLLKRSLLEALRVPKIDKLQLVKKEYSDEFKTRTSLHEVGKKSKVRGFSKSMRMLTTEATWQRRPGYKQHAQLVMFMYLPEEKKKA